MPRTKGQRTPRVEISADASCSGSGSGAGELIAPPHSRVMLTLGSGSGHGRLIETWKSPFR